ncbi:MAG: hypothetical protein WC781_05215 [Candidatus Pacearchaeota archaeon]|jgi:hypothetical protein
MINKLSSNLSNQSSNNNFNHQVNLFSNLSSQSSNNNLNPNYNLLKIRKIFPEEKSYGYLFNKRRCHKKNLGSFYLQSTNQYGMFIKNGFYFISRLRDSSKPAGGFD